MHGTLARGNELHCRNWQRTHGSHGWRPRSGRSQPGARARWNCCWPGAAAALRSTSSRSCERAVRMSPIARSQLKAERANGGPQGLHPHRPALRRQGTRTETRGRRAGDQAVRRKILLGLHHARQDRRDASHLGNHRSLIRPSRRSLSLPWPQLSSRLWQAAATRRRQDCTAVWAWAISSAFIWSMMACER